MMGGVVYFARDIATGEVKIGHTGSLHVRIDTLRRRGRSVIAEASIPGGRKMEGAFHALLLEDHLGHEWFRGSPAVNAVVSAVRDGSFDLARLPAALSPLCSAASHKGHATRRRAVAARTSEDRPERGAA